MIVLTALDWSQISRFLLTTGVAAGTVSALVAFFVSGFWERRKLIRAERVRAYADYLAADSERWRAFGDRDGARKLLNADEEHAADQIVRQARHEMWRAYALTQVAGSPEVVKAMLTCIRLSDDRQRAFTGRGSAPGQDARQRALAELVTAARRDLQLKALSAETFARQ